MLQSSQPEPQPPTIPAGQRFLDVDTAATYLGTSHWFVRRLVRERRIRFYHVGRHLRFDRADLDAFVDAGRVEPPRWPGLRVRP